MLKVKLLHPNAKLPTVAHPGDDLGYDLYAIEDVTLDPGKPIKVRTGIAVEGPPGYGFILGDRSSMAAKGVTRRRQDRCWLPQRNPGLPHPTQTSRSFDFARSRMLQVS